MKQKERNKYKLRQLKCMKEAQTILINHFVLSSFLLKNKNRLAKMKKFMVRIAKGPTTEQNNK